MSEEDQLGPGERISRGVPQALLQLGVRRLPRLGLGPRARHRHQSRRAHRRLGVDVARRAAAASRPLKPLCRSADGADLVDCSHVRANQHLPAQRGTVVSQDPHHRTGALASRRSLSSRAHAIVDPVLPPGRGRLHPVNAVRLALPGRAGLDHQRAAGLVRGRLLLQRADAGHHRLRRNVAGHPLRARHRHRRGDRRHPDRRADHRHHLHQVRPPDGARPVLGARWSSRRATASRT